MWKKLGCTLVVVSGLFGTAHGVTGGGTSDTVGTYTFECYRYVDGRPTGTWINVKAETKAEAETKALARFRELGGAVDYAVCKY